MPISRLLKTVDFPIIIKQKQHQEILIPKHSFSNSGTEVYPDFINPETLKQIAAYISQSRCALVNILDWDIGNRVDVQQEQIRIFYNVYKTILDKLDHFESLNKKNTILLDKINEKNKKLNNRVGILMDISSRISGVPLSSSEIDFQKQVHIVESFCIGADGLLDNFEKNLEGRETRRGTGGSLVGADQVFSLLVQEKKAVDDALKAFDELHLMVDSSDV